MIRSLSTPLENSRLPLGTEPLSSSILGVPRELETLGWEQPSILLLTVVPLDKPGLQDEIQKIL